MNDSEGSRKPRGQRVPRAVAGHELLLGVLPKQGRHDFVVRCTQEIYLSILNGGPTATQVASEKTIYDAEDQLRAKVRSRSWSTIRLRTLPKRWLGCTRQPSTRPVHAAVAAAWAELQRIYAAGVRGAVGYFARVGELVRVAAFFLDS